MLLIEEFGVFLLSFWNQQQDMVLFFVCHHLDNHVRPILLAKRNHFYY